MAGTSKTVAVLIGIACTAGFADARAAEETRIATGQPRGEGHLDLQLSLGWTREHRTSSVERERVVAGGATAVAPDVLSHHTRHTLHLRAEGGVAAGIGVFVTAPIVVSDERALTFAGGVQPGEATILRDRILPGGTSSFGLDAKKNRPFLSGSDTLFRGPTRRGLEYLGLGGRWALLDHERDDTKPTWVVGLEGRLAVGGQMQFDPSRPNANTAVGPGFHQLVPSTAFSSRFGWLEPFLSLSYMFPIPTDDGPFADAHLGSNAFGRPQQRITTAAGFDALVWENPRARQRIALTARGHMELRMQGLALSELWEPLSGASSCPATATACRPGVDRDMDGDRVIDPNPGVTRSPTYGVFGGDVALNVRVGELVRFRALFGMTYEQARFLTDARSGDLVYDQPGRRFFIDDGRVYWLSLESILVF